MSSTNIARECKNALEAVHSFIYFAPEAEQEFSSLGLESGHMAYFAGRAAPMGAVGPGVVAATFFNFNPAAVARVIPHAWTLAAPRDVVAARFRAVDAALRRMLGDELIASETVTDAAALAREATAACLPDGKPLFAAHADLDWPEPAHLQLWHAVTLLREFRGDAHIAALQTAGLTGLQAVVFNDATGKGLNRQTAQRTRAWTDEDWTKTVAQLHAQGLLNADGSFSDEGARMREEIETATDTQSMAPWMYLGAEKVERLAQHGATLSRKIADSGAFPAKLFGHQ